VTHNIRLEKDVRSARYARSPASQPKRYPSASVSKFGFMPFTFL
jgi:hypothetical protein